MRAVPRPSTAGRARAPSVTLPQQTTPRGTSSGVSDSLHLAPCAPQPCRRTCDAEIQTEPYEDNVELHRKRLEELQKHHAASIRATDTLTAALQRATQHTTALSDVTASRNALVERVGVLERELSKQRTIAPHVARSTATQNVRHRNITLIDITGMLGSAAASTVSAISNTAIHLEHEGHCLRNDVVRHHAPATESHMERMRREWRTSQRQPTMVLMPDDIAPISVKVHTTAATTAVTTTSPHPLTPQDHTPEPAVAALKAAMASQQEIIACLERENTALRKQRDAQVESNAREHTRLMQELEETQHVLDERGADWHEKQKELNRLRTLMRFSQLKRDSDKLQESYARLDELENRIRQLHAQNHHDALDKEDLRRLRVIELQLRKVFAGEMSMASFPRELLTNDVVPHGGYATPVTPQQIVVAAPMARPVRPSTAKVVRTSSCAPPSTLPEAHRNVQPSTSPHASISNSDVVTTSVIASVGDAVPRVPGVEQSSVVSHPSNTPTEPAAHVRDEDVSFSTIAGRMQAYLDQRAKQKAEPTAVSSTHRQRPVEGAASNTAAGALSLFARRLEQLRHHPTSTEARYDATHHTRGIHPSHVAASSSVKRDAMERGAKCRPSSASVHSRRVM